MIKLSIDPKVAKAADAIIDKLESAQYGEEEPEEGYESGLTLKQLIDALRNDRHSPLSITVALGLLAQDNAIELIERADDFVFCLFV